MNHLSYLIAAYFVFWIATTVYLVLLHRRQKEVQRAIQRLSEQLDKS